MEVLTTTAIQGELQAENMKAMRRQVGQVAESTAQVNIRRAIQLYRAEKGVNPPSLEALVPEYLPELPLRPDGTPYGYDPVTGTLLEGPGPTAHPDALALAEIRAAVDRYGRTTGWYPPSLDALVPEYLSHVPVSASGAPFRYDPATGRVFPPAATAPHSGTGQSHGGQGGLGPMGEAATGMGVRNELGRMGSSASSAAGSWARQGTQDIGATHTDRQMRVMDDLGF